MDRGKHYRQEYIPEQDLVAYSPWVVLSCDTDALELILWEWHTEVIVLHINHIQVSNTGKWLFQECAVLFHFFKKKRKKTQTFTAILEFFFIVGFWIILSFILIQTPANCLSQKVSAQQWTRAHAWVNDTNHHQCGTRRRETLALKGSVWNNFQMTVK